MLAIVTHRSVALAIAFYGTLKGLLIAIVVVAVTNSFGNAVLIAVISGSLGILGMVLAAWISARAFHRGLAPDLADVKRKLGAAQRLGDVAELEQQELPPQEGN